MKKNVNKIKKWKIQEAQQTLSRINIKEATPNHIIIKFLNNDKEKLLKAAGEREHVTYRIEFSTPYTALKPCLFCLVDFHK